MLIIAGNESHENCRDGDALIRWGTVFSRFHRMHASGSGGLAERRISFESGRVSRRNPKTPPSDGIVGGRPPLLESAGLGLLGMASQVQNLLGFGLLTQAGLAVGLVMTVARQFPEYYGTISTVVLSAVVLYEMIGPIGTKFAVVRSGEARIGRETTQSIWA